MIPHGRLVPVIESGETLVGLRELLDRGVFKAAGIRGHAHQVLAELG